MKKNFIIFLLLFTGEVLASGEDKAVLSAYKVIKDIGGALNDECVTYTPSKVEKDFFLVEVRGRNDRPSCQGDINVAPKLHNILIDYNNNSIFIDGELFKNKTCYKESSYKSLELNLAYINSNGRKYLFSNPNLDCKVDNIFLINNDEIYLIGEVGNFYKISYSSKKYGEISAWIEKSDVKIKPE